MSLEKSRIGGRPAGYSPFSPFYFRRSSERRSTKKKKKTNRATSESTRILRDDTHDRRAIDGFHSDNRLRLPIESPRRLAVSFIPAE